MTDKDLKQQVQNALDWEPSIEATDVGVSANEGVVTLRGYVRTYSEKQTAERVVLRVFGVRAVANDLDVRLPTSFARTDTEIAQAAVSALSWNSLVPEGRVTVTVADGWITLNGNVPWQYQKDAARRSVRDLFGVKGVINSVVLEPQVKATDVRDKIEAAFRRSAEVDARRINVNATDGKIVLSGDVRSYAERQEAERAAWAAPGVKQVEDRLVIVP
ncbi:MAG TPA: BON domain-containing protein [Vicinamibacterales bacterium]|jgi:osmotically-inducible protein OsmY|nr:BON domain-containing protein [Vicinamibacterales bacterium]